LLVRSCTPRRTCHSPRAARRPEGRTAGSGCPPTRRPEDRPACLMTRRPPGLPELRSDPEAAALPDAALRTVPRQGEPHRRPPRCSRPAGRVTGGHVNCLSRVSRVGGLASRRPANRPSLCSSRRRFTSTGEPASASHRLARPRSGRRTDLHAPSLAELDLHRRTGFGLLRRPESAANRLQGLRVRSPVRAAPSDFPGSPGSTRIVSSGSLVCRSGFGVRPLDRHPCRLSRERFPARCRTGTLPS
jgi:hypothetical protein